jgi:transcriptional regulator with XRE-family HTH domain
MSRIILTETPDAELLQELGERLRALRKRRKMSQQTAADRSGISRRTLWGAEKGENPTLLTVIRLLRTYGRLGALDDFIPGVELSPMEIVARTKPHG